MADSKPIQQGSYINKWENDKMRCLVSGRLNGLYYYYLEPGLYTTIVDDQNRPLQVGKIPDHTSILGTTDAICNVAYVPFINVLQDDVYRVPYDRERFGVINYSDGEVPENWLTVVPFVFRLYPKSPLNGMGLCDTRVYPKKAARPNPNQKRGYLNESRLFDYPYRTIVFSSNMFDPFEVIPGYVSDADRNANTIQLQANTQVNPGGNFFLIVPGYKGDNSNFMERQYSTSSMDLPNTSSAYSNYMATQKAQAQTGQWTSFLRTGATVAGSVIGMAAGGPIGAAAGGALLSGTISAGATIAENMAVKTDLRTTPNSLKTLGGDVFSRMGRQDKAYVVANEKVISDEYRRSIGDYFAMYGYKQNKVMLPLLRSRYYYNYVKTVGACIRGTGVPKKHLNTLRAIFDKGITLWHVDRGGKFLDYTNDNTEMIFVP